jgi:hypothetical protein
MVFWLSAAAVLIPSLFILLYGIWSGLVMKMFGGIDNKHGLGAAFRLSAYQFGFMHLIVFPIGVLIWPMLFLILPGLLIQNVIMLAKAYETGIIRSFLVAVIAGFTTLFSASFIIYLFLQAVN